MTRMTRARLDALVDIINEMTGIPEDAPYHTDGRVLVGAAYGGYRLELCRGTHGGVSHFGDEGYGTMREAAHTARGAIAALRLVQDTLPGTLQAIRAQRDGEGS